MEKSQATRLRHASTAPQTDDVSTLMQNKAIHCSRHRYSKKKKCLVAVLFREQWAFVYLQDTYLIDEICKWTLFFWLYRILFDFVKMNESIVSHRMYITLIGQKCTIGKYGGQLKQFDHCYRVHINGFHSFWRSWTWLTEWQDSFGYTLFKEDFEKAF